MRVLDAALAAAAWGAAVHGLRDLRRDPANPALRHLIPALIAASLSFTVRSTAPALDRATGVAGVDRVASNSLTLVATTASLGLLLHMAGPERAGPRLRRRIAALVGCVALMASLVAIRSVAQGAGPRVLDHQEATPSLAAAPDTVVYLTFLGWIVLEAGLFAFRRRSTGLAGSPLLALGLHTFVGGTLLGVGYAAVELAAGLAATWGAPSPVLDGTASALYLLAAAAILAGATLPAWGPRLGVETAVDRLAARATCRRLRPLWKLLYAATPQIALLPHPRRAQLRRARLTVEILDGCALLAPWTNAAAARRAEHHAAARGLAPSARAAAVEATALAVAAQRKRQGRPPASDPVSGGVAPHGAHSASAAEQAAWLANVARALRRSPVVTATLAELQTPEPGTHLRPNRSAVR